MKKILSIALAVVMVLSLASVAMAFDWSAPTSVTTDENFGFSIEVKKYGLNTATVPSSSYYTEEPNAAAVNNGPVYYSIILKVDEPSDATREATTISIDATALSGITDVSFDIGDEPTAGAWYTENTIFYYDPQAGAFQTLEELRTNHRTPVFEATCLDTNTAEIEATVSCERSLAESDWFNVGNYDICIYQNNVLVREANDNIGTGDMIATFVRNSNDLVTDVYVSVQTAPAGYGDEQWTDDPNALVNLYGWLNAGSATDFQTAINNDEVYMTDANLRAAFGFSYSSSDSVTWTASTTPIILDPIVSIPKTGDNASVIGFAMIMVAVVAAAVAVKKVKA